MSFGQQNFGQQKSQIGGLMNPSSGTAFSFQLGSTPQNTGLGQLATGGGLTLGQGTGAGVGVAQAGALPGAQTGQLQLGGLQTSGLLGQPTIGQMNTLQSGGLQTGMFGQTSQTGGLQLGGQQTAGQQLKLGQMPQSTVLQTSKAGGGLQIGGLQQTQGGLQLAQTSQSTGLQLGQPNRASGPQLPGYQQTQGGLQLAQTSQSTGLQLGQPNKASGPQLPGYQQTQGGLQLAQTSQSTGLQLGQLNKASGPQLPGYQQTQGGLQLGQASQTTGLQTTQVAGLQTTQASVLQQQGQTSKVGGLQLGGLQSGQIGQTGGLQLGQAGQSGGLKLGQTSQAGGPQLGQAGLQIGGGLSKTITSSSATATTTLQTTNLGLTLTQTVAPLSQQTKTTTTISSTANGGLKLGMGLPGPPKLGSGTGGGLQLGTTATTGQGLGLGGLQTTSQTTTAAVSLGVAPTTGTTTAFKGLGGVDPSSTTGKGKGNDSPASVVDASLPDLLVQLVEGFKKFVKLQKETSDEISKFSDTSLKKVQQDIGTQTQVLAVASTQIKKDAQTVNFLGQETSEELRNAEVAQRTRELPAWLQKENTAPDHYFQHLVSSFEAKMELYRRQIEELESHLSAISPETGVSPQTVIEILQLQYKPFLLLAAQLQTTHEQVQVLKEQYLNYRKVFLQDSTDVFEEKRKKAKLDNGGTETIQTGPSPFSSQMGHTTTGLTNLLGTKGNTGLSLPGIGVGGFTNPSLGVGLSGLQGTRLGGGASLGTATNTLGQGLSLGSSISQPSLGSTAPVTNPITQKPFQLMKPPLGKRRNA